MTSPTEFTGTASSQEISDQEWLQGLQFRHATVTEMTAIATAGDVAGFTQSLLNSRKIAKKERRQGLEQLAVLWQNCRQEPTDAHRGSLADCLFDADLENEEFSGRVEAIMAGTQPGTPESSTLVAALWVLLLAPQRLESQTLFSLWRWTFEGCRQQASTHEEATAEAAFAAFDALEIQCLSGWLYADLKGEQKQAKQATKALQQALDAATDGDGTFQARWLNQILPRLGQLARMTVFAKLTDHSLWDRKSSKLITRMFGRTVSLLTPERLAFSSLPVPQVCRVLRTVAEIFEIPVEGATQKLLKDWESGKKKPFSAEQEQTLRKQVQKESHQSDWAEWGNLRSAWSSPVDQCSIRFDGSMPGIEVIAGNVPLFSGVWSHKLTIDGQEIVPAGEWACCCWYLDKEAAYMEVQLKADSGINVIRQALLLRQESVLILGDSVRLPSVGQMEFQRSVPLMSDWDVEQDTATRELALVQDQQRVRVFPWTSPQSRMDRSSETTFVKDGNLQLQTKVEGTGLYAATLFDWSKSRRDEPVDWSRLTVAEDGKILAPDIAAACRLRIGKQHWVSYHSLVKPGIPRTVLGIHSANESIIAQFGADGEVRTLVEVEL